MNNREVIKLQEERLQLTNKEPLVSNFTPIELPHGGLDIDVPISEIKTRKLQNAEVAATVQQDKLVVGHINFGPALVPALFGAHFDYDKDTSWNHPITNSIQDLEIVKPSFDNPLWIQYEERLEQLLKGWSYDTYIPSVSDFLGPLDILSALIGPETLSMALLLEPDIVKEKSIQIAHYLIDVFKHQDSLIKSAGLTEGNADVFSKWLPGGGVTISEDFSALVSPAHYEEFFLEPDSIFSESIATAILHTHSVAHKTMDNFVKIRNLRSIEIGNDPNGPDMDTRIIAAQKIQAAGLGVEFGSWEIPLPIEEIDKALSSLKKEGIIFCFQPGSIKESKDLYKYIKNFYK
jgi:hypothetical protein